MQIKIEENTEVRWEYRISGDPVLLKIAQNTAVQDLGFHTPIGYALRFGGMGRRELNPYGRTGGLLNDIPHILIDPSIPPASRGGERVLDPPGQC
jgi:hypothetical protein